ncbi:histidine phosphatase family protein [Clostridium sp.]|uniref:histidine phosphatase family protein n=1 Tax=Clostridium sp. TaxID=1506 RepID=UPI0034643C33
MTKIYFIRHGKINYTEDDYSRELSEEGIEDVKKIKDVLKDHEIHKVYSSPYIRAINTIKELALIRELNISTIDDLRERKVCNEFIEDFKGFSMKQWEDFEYSLEGGESLRQVQERGIKALYKIIDENKGKSIVIGTHGTFLGMILNYFDKKYDFEFWKAIKMPYIFLLTFDEKELISVENIYA